MHPGLRAIFIGLALTALGAAGIAAMVMIHDPKMSNAATGWFFFIGFLVVILTLAGPAVVILSAKDIFRWIAATFGTAVLAGLVLLLAVLLTILLGVAVVMSVVEGRFRPVALVLVGFATFSLWAFFFGLMRQRRRRPAALPESNAPDR